MPINGTSPVATKALSVASKKLCLSPVAWPSLRANGSLAAASFLHNLPPSLRSMTWTTEAHDERPQCRASRQYPALASLLDIIPPSFAEPGRQIGTRCSEHVDIDMDVTAAGSTKSVPAVGQSVQEDMRTSPTKSVQGAAAADSENAFRIVDDDNSCVSDNLRSLDSRRSVHDLPVPVAAIDNMPSPQIQAMEETELGDKVGNLGSRSYLHPSAMFSNTLVGNPGIAMSLARQDYEAYVQRLERRCFDLFAENQELRVSAEKAKAIHARSQELNLRLGREVQQARKESAAATEHLRQYVEKADKIAARSKRRRANRDQSTQTSSCNTTEHWQDISAFETQQDAHDLLPRSDETLDIRLVGSPPGLEHIAEVSGSISQEEETVSACKCGESCSWGCHHHRCYRSDLLLAQRDLQIRIARGPPGLELPCDHIANANSADLGISLAPVASLMRTRKYRRGHARI